MENLHKKNIPEFISVGVYFITDEYTGEIEFDFEEMTREFNIKISELNVAIDNQSIT
jgi:hypothetical protein